MVKIGSLDRNAPTKQAHVATSRIGAKLASGLMVHSIGSMRGVSGRTFVRRGGQLGQKITKRSWKGHETTFPRSVRHHRA